MGSLNKLYQCNNRWHWSKECINKTSSSSKGCVCTASHYNYKNISVREKENGKVAKKKEPVSRLKSTLTEHNDEGRWQVKWVENEEMVLEETRGRAKELTKVSDDRNSKETQFFSCEAVL